MSMRLQSIFFRSHLVAVVIVGAYLLLGPVGAAPLPVAGPDTVWVYQKYAVQGEQHKETVSGDEVRLAEVILSPTKIVVHYRLTTKGDLTYDCRHTFSIGFPQEIRVGRPANFTITGTATGTPVAISSSVGLAPGSLYFTDITGPPASLITTAEGGRAATSQQYTLQARDRGDGIGELRVSLQWGPQIVYTYAKGGAAQAPIPQPGEMAIEDNEFVAVDANVLFTKGIQLPLAHQPDDGELQLISQLSVRRDGACADGVSLLLLRVGLNKNWKEGTCRFELNGTDADGTFWTVHSRGFLGPEARTIETRTYRVNGRHYAFALYRPPLDFGSRFAAQGFRQFKIKATFRPKPGDPIEANSVILDLREKECPIKLVRPPVVLVHGTYDNPRDCWDYYADYPGMIGLYHRLKQAGFFVMMVDYAKSSGAQLHSYFDDNQRVVWANPGGIAEALKVRRSTGIAATQADLVCHSMGGVLARKYAEGGLPAGRGPDDPHYSNPDDCSETCYYHRLDNFMKGDIHRLVTISSTHMGSDICRFLTACRMVRGEGSIFTDWDRMMGGILNLAAHHASGVYTGAFRDQVPQSSALREIKQTRIPVHAIACVADKADLDDFYRDRMNLIWSLVTPGLLERSFGTYMGQAADGQILSEYSRKESEMKVKLLREENINPSLIGNLTEHVNTRRAIQAEIKSLHENAVDRLRMAVFGNTPNDCTVRRESSWGGLAPRYCTLSEKTLHSRAPYDPAVQQRVISLLKGPPSNFDPRGFPPAGGKTIDLPATASVNSLPKTEIPAIKESTAPPSASTDSADLQMMVGPVPVPIGLRKGQWTITSVINHPVFAQMMIKAGDRIMQINGKNTDGLSRSEMQSLLDDKQSKEMTIVFFRTSDMVPLTMRLVKP